MALNHILIARMTDSCGTHGEPAMHDFLILKLSMQLEFIRREMMSLNFRF